MNGVPSTLTSENSLLKRVWGYVLTQINSDSGELTVGGDGSAAADATGGETTTETEGTEVEGTEVEADKVETEETETEETEVDTESEAFKTAVSSKVEAVVGERVSRGVDAQKAKTTEAETRATTAEAKLTDLEQSVATLTEERDTAKSAEAQKDGIILKLKLAIEENVSVEFIEKLKGDTEDELRAAIKEVSGAARSSSADRIFNGKDRAPQSGSRSSSMIETGLDFIKNRA